MKIDLEACPDRRRRVTYGVRGVECEKCDNWFLEKFQNNDDQFHAKLKGMVGFCSNCQKNNKLDSELETERQLFERYVRDINITVSARHHDILPRKANTAHII